ncbi:hypothetical protein Q5M87_11800 [Brachyspira innocens]|uniref:Lipoprotein n=1 Tax=Brachyspira innocens TaxID=13264 RepID=A0ABT8YXT4_9SPIR|nr:hypothetical protein [Brachyspira innocens]MDO6994690.1 hypothetical protein [Brachyspira innocens]MDO7020691.1 hypothetical protein [Brachyspira innocens]
MKRIILILSILSALVISCNSKQAPTIGDKPLTTIVPSDDKNVKEGTLLSDWDGSTQSLAINASVKANNTSDNNTSQGNTQTPEGYSLLDRLYSTTWYQSEEDYDDGRLETEEEFILFNSASEICKREYENGRIDGRDEYSTLVWVDDVALDVQDDKKSRNACIVQNKERYDNDTEYEGYYLVDRDTLYIVDGDRIDDVKRKLNDIISGNTQRYTEDKFVLSTKALN